MKISQHYTRAEIACKCGCGFDSMDVETLRVADEAREFEGAPITPSSGCRCPSHNRAVGGSSKSLHVQARAMDLPSRDPVALYNYLCEKYPDKYGFGLYKTFVHVDTKSGPARRWEG